MTYKQRRTLFHWCFLSYLTLVCSLLTWLSACDKRRSQAECSCPSSDAGAEHIDPVAEQFEELKAEYEAFLKDHETLVKECAKINDARILCEVKEALRIKDNKR